MLLRRLAPLDRPAVVDILSSDDTFRPEEIDVALELVDGACDAPDGDYRALVCEDAGQLLGYVCYGRTPMTDATWDLYWIAVHRDARGKGVASKLARAMEADARALGGAVVRIETSQLESYGSARSLYDRLAYVEVGRIGDFYRAGDDLVILAKRIDLAPAGVVAGGIAAVVAPAPLRVPA